MKLRVLYLLFGFALSIAGYYGIVYYYGWKPALFLFLILWSNNIGNSETFKNLKN